MKKNSFKNGVALLITVFFVMLITVSLGLGLKLINDGKESVDSEKYMYQNAMALQDVLRVLNSLPEVQEIANANDLANFLLLSEVVPLESQGLSVLVSFSSARSKINPNAFKEKAALDGFRNFLINRGVDTVYADYIYDSINGIKEDQTYTTDIFNQNPEIFRDYIASKVHLQKIDQIFLNNYHDPKIKEIDNEELFYFSKDTNSTIDLNHATAEVFEVVLGCDELRAQALSMDENIYESTEDMRLSDQEKLNLVNFKTSFFEPYLDVDIETLYLGKKAHIRFEYNIKSKKGSNFVFEV